MDGNWELKQRLDQFKISTNAMCVDSFDQYTAEWGWGHYLNFKEWLETKNYSQETITWAGDEMGWMFRGFQKRFQKDVWKRAKSSSIRCRRFMCR